MKRAPGGSGSSVRIIGGCWRGRRLHFSPADDLRPTPDRIRETLFNWLSPLLPGARCLDLFAGSGVLGMEALSRGAAEVVFVERNAGAVRRLRDNLTLLKTDRAKVELADAIKWLQGGAEPFDIVWLDPPFASDLLTPVCRDLEQRGWLRDDARIYLEADRRQCIALPADWNVTKYKNAGKIAYRLAVRSRPLR